VKRDARGGEYFATGLILHEITLKSRMFDGSICITESKPWSEVGGALAPLGSFGLKYPSPSGTIIIVCASANASQRHLACLLCFISLFFDAVQTKPADRLGQAASDHVFPPNGQPSPNDLWHTGENAKRECCYGCI